jgi:hypothetical protein
MKMPSIMETHKDDDYTATPPKWLRFFKLHPPLRIHPLTVSHHAKI